MNATPVPDGPGNSAKSLALSRGWRVCRAFRLRIFGCENSLSYVLDHLEYFSFGGKPHALLTHSYASRKIIDRFAREHGLLTEYLPASWHNEKCLAVILTRAK